jgi:RNA polymerase sigma factor (sigma-70 family)
MGFESGVEALRRSAHEPEAFARFYDQHAERLLAYLARRVYDPDVALDLTAESFAQAYVSRRRFRGSTDGEAAGWLYRIARRQLARYFRKARVEREALERLGLEPPVLDDAQRARIEELADLVDLRSTLRLELERLSRANRDALQLRVIEELPYSEIARRLDISEHTARARVSRGLRALAAGLERSALIKETLA